MKKILTLLAITFACVAFSSFGNDRSFLIVFGRTQTKDSLSAYINRIEANKEFKVLRFCQDKNAFLCTADSFKYPALCNIDREAHNPLYNLPKCYIKLLETSDSINMCN